MGSTEDENYINFVASTYVWNLSTITAKMHFCNIRPSTRWSWSVYSLSPSICKSLVLKVALETWSVSKRERYNYEWGHRGQPRAVMILYLP